MNIEFFDICVIIVICFLGFILTQILRKPKPLRLSDYEVGIIVAHECMKIHGVQTCFEAIPSMSYECSYMSPETWSGYRDTIVSAYEFESLGEKSK